MKNKSENNEEELDGKPKGLSAGGGYTLGLNFVTYTLISGFLGYWLDGFFDTKPWLMLIFMLLGFCSAMLQVWKSLKTS